MHAPLPLVTPVLYALLAATPSAAAAAARTSFPIRPSPDGRYLVDASGKPFFWHADTAWTITKKLTAQEVDEYLDRRKAQGWNTIHIHAVSKEQGPVANRDGAEPFAPLDDITRPHEPYWKHVDHVVSAAAQRDLLVAMSALWIRPGGKDREGWRGQFDEERARVYGKFLAKRYGRFKNLVWVMGGDANPIEKTAAVQVLAQTLHAAAPHQLQTYHGGPDFSSAAWFHGQRWLRINTAYTYQETHKHVLAEWVRPGQARPIVLLESGYEEESNDKRGGSPHRMRRQGWGAVLSGALGGHAYGHKAIWRFSSDWRSALDAPGARHLGVMREVLAGVPWQTLVPDVDDRLVTVGRSAVSRDEFVPAARSRDGRFALVYLPGARTVTVDLGRLTGMVSASWIDPTSGARNSALETPVPARGTRELTPLARNAAGDGDWVLLLESGPPSSRPTTASR